jgi:hypothetical protein
MQGKFFLNARYGIACVQTAPCQFLEIVVINGDVGDVRSTEKPAGTVCVPAGRAFFL